LYRDDENEARIRDLEKRTPPFEAQDVTSPLDLASSSFVILIARMKRALHYLLLAAVLIGLPLGCAWIGGKGEMLADVAAFPPKGDEWMQMTERLWAVRCPFSWSIFCFFFAITAASVAPFLWRMVRGMSGVSRRPSNQATEYIPLVRVSKRIYQYIKYLTVECTNMSLC